MAEKEVLFEDNMETQAQDFNNLQDWIGTSIDDIVVDAIDAGNAYTGLGISKAAATQVTIAPGRLYWGGVVYIMEDPITIDFQTVAGAMPVTQQRQIAIVAWGSTITTDVQPRNFVVDADTGQAQPESVAMTQIRTCNVGPIPGVEAPSPNYPAVPATNLLIGYVLLNPSGVVSIQQTTATQLTNLTSLANVVGGMMAWQGIVNGQISTLQTSLASLAASLANYVTLDMFSKLTDLVNQIWQMVNKPAQYALDSIDNFFDLSQSAVGTNVDGPYAANVAEGIRFVSNGNWTGKLVLLNNTEPAIQAWDTFVLPKPSGMRVRMDCSFQSLDWVAERILGHPYWTYSPRKLAWARERFRCGVPFLPCPSPTVFAWTGTLDPVYCNLRFDAGDTWPGIPCNQLVKYPDDDWDFPRYIPNRNFYYWEDAVDVFYWSKVSAALHYNHNHFGQSFLNSQDGWLGGITVFSMVPAYYQPLTLLIYRCDDQGVPDHQQCIAQLDLDAAGVQACYSNPVQLGDLVAPAQLTPALQSWFQAGYRPGDLIGTTTGSEGARQYVSFGFVVVPTSSTFGGEQVFNIFFPGFPVFAYPVRLTFSPVYLEAGKRYSFHLGSQSDHQFAVSIDPSCYSVHHGDFWEYDGSAWFRVVTGGPRTLRFMLHYLVWGQYGQNTPTGQLRYDVEMQPLSLTGGIQSVDILAEHIIPSATDLSYALFLNNQWQPFDSNPNNPTPLNSSVQLARLKIVFTGTTDLMPGVSLTNSQVKLTGTTQNQFYHISTNVARGSPTVTGLQVITNSTNFVPAHHTLNCFIHTTARQTATTIPPPVLLSDGVTTQHVWQFTTGVTSVSNYQVELSGGTDGTGDNFVVNQRSAYGK
jgi:hypothetical protein